MDEKIQDDLDIKICTETAGYCKDAPIQDDYNLEEDITKDELWLTDMVFKLFLSFLAYNLHLKQIDKSVHAGCCWPIINIYICYKYLNE